MKKYILIIFILFQSLWNYGQNPIDGNWISDNLDFLSIKDTLFQLETKGRLRVFTLFRKDTLLIFQSHYTIASDDEKKYSKYVYKVDFKNDSLILSGRKIIGRDVFRPKNEYRFINEKHIKSDNFKFQSIAFKGTSCFGKCSKMNIKIDSIGNLSFRGEENTANILGNFIGKLSESQLSELIAIMKKIELDKFPEFLGYADDAPTYYFTFNYNDKIKKSVGYNVPHYTRELLIYLLTIYKKVTLRRVDYDIKYDN